MFATVACTFLPRVSAGRFFSESERRTLILTADAFLEAAPLDVSAERVSDNVEAFLIAGRSRRAWRVRVLLTLIELSTIPTHARFFSDLSREERRALMRDRWTSGAHVFRICAKIRNLVVLGAYGDHGAGAKTGYVPVPQRQRFRRAPATDAQSDFA